LDYAALKAQLRGLINRNDMTDELAANFIQMAQDRLERWPQVDPARYAPRPSFMEKYVKFNLTPVDTPDTTAFQVPPDFLQIISLHSSEGELERVGTSGLLQYLEAEGTPKVFMQAGHFIHLRPMPAETEDVFMLYFAASPTLVEDTDENEWTSACYDALLYGAAVYAADHFEDERLARFDGRFSQALMELQDQTINESLSGSMRMASAYNYPDDN
jgi:hypothetical protein